MRIVLLSADRALPLAGPQRAALHLRALAESWLRDGHEVSALVAEPGTPRGLASLVERGLEVRPLRQPVSEREVDWHLSHVRPELAIERLMPASPQGARACAEAGVPHVYEVADGYSDDLLREAGCTRIDEMRHDFVEGFASSAGSVCASAAAARWVRTLAPRTHATSIEPGSVPRELLQDPTAEQLDCAMRRMQLDRGEFRIGVSASRASVADLLTLVEAAGRLRSVTRPRLLMVGDGPWRNDVMRHTHEHRVPVVMCGRTSAEERPMLFALCDAVVIAAASREEQVRPQEVLDLMAAGRPLVASATEPMRRFVRSGHDGLLVEPGDVDALHAALSALARGPALGAALGTAARTRVAERHAHDAVASRMLEFAEELRATRRVSG